jgi:hypothetical protein
MADPEQMLWPLRAVSKDPTNITKLDADGNVLTSSADVVAAVGGLTGIKGDKGEDGKSISVSKQPSQPATAEMGDVWIKE